MIIAVVHDGERRQIALQIDPAAFAGQIEAQIAYLRPAGRRPIDLVDDAVTDRSPEPRAAERDRYCMNQPWLTISD
jgi:hypothetical protein